MALPPYDAEIIRCGIMFSLVAVQMDERALLQVLLNLSPRVLDVSPMYSSSQVSSPHWYK